jgi:hypothetical protein
LTFMGKKCINDRKNKRNSYGQKKLFKFRERVNRMYFDKGMGKNEIIRKLHSNKRFVLRWTQSPYQDFEEDNRGWKKGKMRKWDKKTLRRIEEVHQHLSNDPHKYFTGATAISQELRKRYPDGKVPPLRTIGKMLSDLRLSGKRKKGRNKGAASYLCYPEYTLYNLLGGRVLEADFIEKYLKGRTSPVNFIGFSFKQAPKLRYYRRIGGQTKIKLINSCEEFFQKFERPDFMKVDNGAATIGSISAKRCVSGFMVYLLKNRVIPIFSVPRKPFSQASIEGNNSVFSRFFWNRSFFNNVSEIDEQLEWFNKASLEYLRYEKPEKKSKKKGFIPRVYFLRQIGEDEQTGKGYIRVLNEIINLPKSYINFFVLTKWNLKEEVLYIYFERNKRSKIIKKVDFRINKTSKKKMKKGGLLLFCQ